MTVPDEFDVRVEDGAALVCPTGELDLATAPALRAAIQRALQSAPDAVVIDLTHVTFVDSTALAIFVEARREASAADIAFHVTKAAPNVRRVLAVTNLTHLLCPD